MLGMNVSRRGFVKLSAIAAASLGLGACRYAATDPNAIQLGGIGPTTGPAAIYGVAARNGAKCAVDKINQQEGRTFFEFRWEDDENDAEKSINAYESLRDWGMQILVGTVTTAPCVAVSTDTNVDRYFELTPSASSTDVIGGQADALGNVTVPRKDNVFQMCFTDPNQGLASARYIHEQQLAEKIAVIYNNSDVYSSGVYKKFASEAERLGLQIVSTTTFTDDSANDFTVQLNKAKGAGADFVFLPIYYTPAALILTQARAMDYAPKFFGVDGLDGILTLENFDVSIAEGLMLLTPFVATAKDELTQEFVKAYKETTGSNENPTQFAADGYDCVFALYNAIKGAEERGFKPITPNTTPQDACETLISIFTTEFKFSGLTGEHMSWSSSGEVSKDPKAMIIKNGVYELMETK